VGSSHEFASCDTRPGWCSSDCLDDNSYAVWGGFADGADDSEVISNTKDVICN